MEKLTNSIAELITLAIALLIALVYSLKLYDELHATDENAPKNKGKVIRQLIYGAFGSGLVCVLVCEALIYLNLPFTLSLVVGAWCGYMGADIIKDTVLKYIDRKFEKGGA